RNHRGGRPCTGHGPGPDHGRPATGRNDRERLGALLPDFRYRDAIMSTGSLSSFSSLPLFLLRFRAYLALIVLVVLFSLTAPAFLTFRNLVIVAEQVAVFAILGIGMTFVILGAGIDLSVGSLTGLSAM